MAGFLKGLFWGAIVAGGGLAVLSQVVLPPVPAAPDRAADPAIGAVPEAGDGAAGDVAVPAPLPKAPEAEVQPEILQKGPEVEAPKAEPTAASTDPAAQGVESKSENLMSSPLPAVTSQAPDAPAGGATQEAAGTLPAALDELRPGLAAPAAIAPPPGGEAAPAPAEPPPAPPQEDAPSPAEPRVGADPAAVTDAPQGGGVTTDRLPRIGDAAPQGAAPEASADTAPGAGADGVEDPGPGTPLSRFARDFSNPQGKPLFALVLIDDGSAPADRDSLAALPFPVTFALDPLWPDSAEASRIYRAAGQEVAMLATGVPEGATAGDVAQAFQAMDRALPEAVVVLDRPEGGWQETAEVARSVVPVVAEQGRGLLTYDRGLNPAAQVARREGVPAAVIFRVLDGEGESIPKMRNYLDRAAFKAAQEGQVVVIGRTRPETVAAILEWTMAGRAAMVALAPVTAVLQDASEGPASP